LSETGAYSVTVVLGCNGCGSRSPYRKLPVNK